MAPQLAWALLLWPLLLLLLLLPRLGSPELACDAFPGAFDWSREFNDSCLNLSGRALRLDPEQPLRARQLQLLDLSGTSLRELPPRFLEPLPRLQVLELRGNPLDRVDEALATRCDLDLRADCTCVLGPWFQARSNNCLGQEPLQCLHPASGAWQNLSTFLNSGCPTGPGPATMAGAVVGGILLLALLMAGAMLAWRRCWRPATGTLDPGKASGPPEGTGPALGAQPRYSSRSLGHRGPTVMPPRTPAPDYENIFVGQAEGRHQWPDHGPHLSEDSDFYMNYGGPSLDAQPLYGNLQAHVQEDEYEISQD
ncbi:leucine-rich repeat-containing protein 25 isoform X2 [Cavia porcellus]